MEIIITMVNTSGNKRINLCVVLMQTCRSRHQYAHMYTHTHIHTLSHTHRAKLVLLYGIYGFPYKMHTQLPSYLY